MLPSQLTQIYHSEELQNSHKLKDIEKMLYKEHEGHVIPLKTIYNLRTILNLNIHPAITMVSTFNDRKYLPFTSPRPLGLLASLCPPLPSSLTASGGAASGTSACTPSSPTPTPYCLGYPTLRICPLENTSKGLWNKFCNLLDWHQEIEILSSSRVILQTMGRAAIAELLINRRFYSVLNILSSPLRDILQPEFKATDRSKRVVTPCDVSKCNGEQYGSLFHILVLHGNVRLMAKYTTYLSRFEYSNMAKMISSLNWSGETCLEVMQKHPRLELMMRYLSQKLNQYSKKKYANLLGNFECNKQSCVCVMFPDHNQLESFKPRHRLLYFVLFCRHSCKSCNNMVTRALIRQDYYNDIDDGRFYEWYLDLTLRPKKMSSHWNDVSDRQLMIQKASNGLNIKLHSILLDYYPDEYDLDIFFHYVNQIMSNVPFFADVFGKIHKVPSMESLYYHVCQDMRLLGNRILTTTFSMKQPNGLYYHSPPPQVPPKIVNDLTELMQLVRVLVTENVNHHQYVFNFHNKKELFTSLHTVFDCYDGICEPLLYLLQDCIMPLVQMLLDFVKTKLCEKMALKMALCCIVIAPRTELEYWAITTPAAYVLKNTIEQITYYQGSPLTKTQYEKYIIKTKISNELWKLISSHLNALTDYEMNRHQTTKYLTMDQYDSESSASASESDNEAVVPPTTAPTTAAAAAATTTIPTTKNKRTPTRTTKTRDYTNRDVNHRSGISTSSSAPPIISHTLIALPEPIYSNL